MIKIIDYGLGNVQAFLNAFKAINLEAGPAKNSIDLKEASHIILPGVGSFDQAMKLLLSSGMRDPIEYMVFEKKIPILGVCVGMQILGNGSEEGSDEGLQWIDGFVKKIDSSIHANQLPLPHMGWNDVFKLKNKKLFKNLNSNRDFYFLHSYHFECYENESEIAKVEYGKEMTCAINKDNIFGVQFHPEKSHLNGINLLKNFASI